MVSPRRTRSGFRPFRSLRPGRPLVRRRTGGLSAAAVLLTAALIVLSGVAPAGAQPAPVPAPPATAADAAAQLEQVQRDAEALTEQWKAAQEDVAARRDDLETMQSAVEPARSAVDAARAGEETYRQQVDAVATSTFESGNLDQFNALLASGSPQEFLDQMSALETLSADYRIALEQLSVVVDTTSLAQADADAAAARAQAAADEAARAEQDLAARKRDAEIRIDEAEKLLERLSPQQRQDRLGPDVDAPAAPVTGTGVGVTALEAARSKLGRPYQWGAEGPNNFDCSGLMYWAFKQAGITLPRTSGQQATVGQKVSRADLQPGDLVFSYSPISHVGVYAGDGKVIAAPQTGDVVKYQKVSDNFTTARRF